MAERQGFEPWRRSPAYTLSRRAPSTTRPPLRVRSRSYLPWAELQALPAPLPHAIFLNHLAISNCIKGCISLQLTGFLNWGKDGDANLTRTTTLTSVLAGAGLIALTLAFWGQPLICTCNTVKLWVPTVFSPDNSQHIADWYTLSHILHGMLVVLVARLVVPALPFAALFAIAMITGVAWEIIEHTEWVLGKFRATTINQGYHGDSVLNAVADYFWMLGGFFLARALPTLGIVAVIVAFELIAAFVARDSLALTTPMLIYPVEAVETWQQQINPLANPEHQ